MIILPYGGRFDEHDLVTHIRKSGRDYIIQGQQKVSLEEHTKPHSLDYWLRQFSREKDTKHAEQPTMDALVSTGLFEEVNNLTDPVTGRACRGLRLVGK